ncbi:hypothetical protein GCM10009544_17310 [Streptomyces stramineus]|uniref:DJ-1/PfpI domain-containing protein n=1 Tax=Streptomyces stramineus TaxID=173861 RepID=A0ABP3JIY4_9ACTN
MRLSLRCPRARRQWHEWFARIPAGARIVSICTGAFALAAAGRLDGRPATTHWKLAARFRELFPEVALGVLRAD